MADNQTILSFHISGSADEVQEATLNAKRIVIEKINELLNECESSGSRFSDPHFGPSASDPLGAHALYRSGKVEWLRPNYKNYEATEIPALAENCSLFEEGHNAADVVQGQLGDCWFLGALAVLASQPKYLDELFFDGNGLGGIVENHQNSRWVKSGLWVLRFYMDSQYHFVIIDDRIPCNPRTRSKSLSELWVSLAEKAYAKLMGSYDSLIGGFIEIGIQSMTGLCPLQYNFQKNSANLKPLLSDDDLFDYIYSELLPPLSANTPVEAVSSSGLVAKHAYSILGVVNIETSSKPNQGLLVIRNPWGQGEWKGKWSDESAEKREYLPQIKQAWSHQQKEIKRTLLMHTAEDDDDLNEEDLNMSILENNDNGIFLMSYEDFLQNYTQVFLCLNFPDSWRGRRVMSRWEGSSAGGNSCLATWKQNPRFKLEIFDNNDVSDVVIQLSQEDQRHQHGSNHMTQLLPVTFHVVPGDFDFVKPRNYPAKSIKNSLGEFQLPIYTYAESVGLKLKLCPGVYYIVPSPLKQGMERKFILSVYMNHDDFNLEGSTIIGEEEEHEIPVQPVDLPAVDDEYYQALERFADLVKQNPRLAGQLLFEYYNLSDEVLDQTIDQPEFLIELERLGIQYEEIGAETLTQLSGADGQYQKRDILNALIQCFSLNIEEIMKDDGIALDETIAASSSEPIPDAPSSRTSALLHLFFKDTLNSELPDPDASGVALEISGSSDQPVDTVPNGAAVPEQFSHTPADEPIPLNPDVMSKIFRCNCGKFVFFQCPYCKTMPDLSNLITVYLVECVSCHKTNYSIHSPGASFFGCAYCKEPFDDQSISEGKQITVPKCACSHALVVKCPYCDDMVSLENPYMPAKCNQCFKSNIVKKIGIDSACPQCGQRLE